MFLGLCAGIILVAVPLTGGSLRAFSELRPRGTPIVVVALALQLLVITVWPTMPHDLAVAGHLASYLMFAAVVWLNRGLPGMWLIGLGAGLNAVAIAANGGTLPASASALRRAGIHERAGFDNSAVVAHPHLAWLGDVMVTPSWLPLRNVMSIGDIVLLVGATLLVWRSTRVASSATGDNMEPCHRPSVTKSRALHPSPVGD